MAEHDFVLRRVYPDVLRLAGTIQLAGSRLLDLLAKAFVVRRLSRNAGRTPHASAFTRICGATVRRPTESFRLSGRRRVL